MAIRCSSCFSEYDEDFGMCPFCGHIEGETEGEVFCLAPGTIIADRYIIGEMLGLGGFGITYKAWDTKLNVTMAIKEYYPSGMVNRLPGDTTVFLVAAKQERAFVYGKTRFLQEARNLAKFSTHKNIVNVFEYFEANNTAYIVMEFLEGKTIREAMRQQNVPFPCDYCVSIAIDICSALNALHKEKILHRDISPDNIMLCTNGTVKLLDFGAARFSAGVESRVSVVVKPGFAPLEQYDKVNKQDERTDIYALGATLYYAMTGIKPEESTDRKVEDTVVEPFVIDNSIPQSISAAIMRAMAVEQDYRFRDADAFVAALKSGKKAVSVQAEQKKRKLKKRIGLAAAILLVVAGMGALLGLIGNNGEERELSPAELDVWYMAAENAEEAEAKKAAMEGVVAEFEEKHSNVIVNVTAVRQGTYAQALSEAFSKGTAPDVFESTILSQDALQQADSLTKQYGALKNSTYLENKIVGQKQMPAGIVVPMIFVNTSRGAIESAENIAQVVEACKRYAEYFEVKVTAVDLYATLYGEEIADYARNTAKEKFLSGDLMIYFGDSSDYFDVQEAMPGGYMLLMPESRKSTYRYSDLWSMAGSDKNTQQAAAALIDYFCGELAQDYFHIQQHSSGLPIAKLAMSDFVGVYDELAVLEEWLEKDYEAPVENAVALLEKANPELLETLKAGASAVFSDVPANAWYAKSISRLYAKNLMNGTGATVFEPESTIRKIDIIIAFYRLAGSPDVKQADVFKDIDYKTEQGQAALWAYEREIASGTGEGEFHPNDPVSFETCMLLLYRYAKGAGYDMTISKKPGQFADGTEIGSWASDAVMWAITQKLVNIQNGGTILPQAEMARGRFAVIFENMLARKPA